MDDLFSKDYALLWTLVLALALFLPVRHLIWVIYMRRAAREGEPDAAETQRLKKRAGITAALICFVFSFFYTNYLFQGSP